MGGLRAIARRATSWFAVTGAWGRDHRSRRGRSTRTRRTAGRRAQELHLDWFAHGARAYLAVRGGLDAPRRRSARARPTCWPGSAPRRSRAGDAARVARRARSAPIPVADLAPWGAPHDDELESSSRPGPRADWFTASALRHAVRDRLDRQRPTPTASACAWTARRSSARATASCRARAWCRARCRCRRAGRPTILLADGPVTGGYPVIAVVTDAALDLLAQARPGTRIRFRHAPLTRRPAQRRRPDAHHRR